MRTPPVVGLVSLGLGPYKETLLCGVIYRNVIPYSMQSRSSVVRGCVPYRGGSGFKPRLVHVLRSNTKKRLKTGKNRYFSSIGQYLIFSK